MTSGKSAISDAYAALAGLPDLKPHEISRNEMTLEMAFEEIDALKSEIDFLKSLYEAILFAVKGSSHGR